MSSEWLFFISITGWINPSFIRTLCHFHFLSFILFLSDSVDCKEIIFLLILATIMYSTYNVKHTKNERFNKSIINFFCFCCQILQSNGIISSIFLNQHFPFECSAPAKERTSSALIQAQIQMLQIIYRLLWLPTDCWRKRHRKAHLLVSHLIVEWINVTNAFAIWKDAIRQRERLM